MTVVSINIENNGLHTKHSNIVFFCLVVVLFCFEYVFYKVCVLLLFFPYIAGMFLLFFVFISSLVFVFNAVFMTPIICAL